MAKPFFLIDFENVQPKRMDRLNPGSSRIKVFLGHQQSKLELDRVQALQAFGADAEYIRIHGSGPNAVDFHIAFYIGRLAAEEPGSAFNIISKDTGFDPLIHHLRALGIACKRMAEIPTAGETVTSPVAPPATKTPETVAKKATAKKAAAKKITASALPVPDSTPAAAKGTTTRARVPEVLALLKKSTKPGTIAALKASIKSWFKPGLDDKAVDAIVQSLQSSKKITVTGTKVAYALG